jgi:hypothetical protein
MKICCIELIAKLKFINGFDLDFIDIDFSSYKSCPFLRGYSPIFALHAI